MSKEEKVKEIELQDKMGASVAHTLKCAASEVLGADTSKFEEYFEIHYGKINRKPAIIVIEKVSKKKHKVGIPFSLIEKDTDKPFYPKLKELAALIAPLIPDSDKDLPKNKWPEPFNPNMEPSLE